MRLPSFACLLFATLVATATTAVAAVSPPPAARPVIPAAGPAQVERARPAAEATAKPPRRAGSSVTWITIGCRRGPRLLTPRPIILLVPSGQTIVITICMSPRDVF